MLRVHRVRGHQHPANRQLLYHRARRQGAHAHSARAAHSAHLHSQPKTAGALFDIRQHHHFRRPGAHPVLRVRRNCCAVRTRRLRLGSQLPAVLRHDVVCTGSRRRCDCRREQHEDAEIVWGHVWRAEQVDGSYYAFVRCDRVPRLFALRSLLPGQHFAEFAAARNRCSTGQDHLCDCDVHFVRTAGLRAGVDYLGYVSEQALRAFRPQADLGVRRAHRHRHRDIPAGRGDSASRPVHLFVRGALFVRARTCLSGPHGNLRAVPRQVGPLQLRAVEGHFSHHFWRRWAGHRNVYQRAGHNHKFHVNNCRVCDVFLPEFMALL